MDSLRLLMVSHHRKTKVNFENRSLAMAKQLGRFGHQVTILCTADLRKTRITEYSEDGVRIVEIPDLLWRSLRSGWDPWSAINRLLYLTRSDDEFDLIHLFESRPAVIHPIQIYHASRHIPIIIDWVDWIGRGGILEVRRPMWYRRVFGGMETFYEEHYRARADGLTVICKALSRRAQQGLGVSSEKILQIPVGADLNLYPAVLDKAACRAEIGLSQDAKIITYAGVDAVFDLPYAIKAFCQVSEQYPDARLMVIGKSTPSILGLAKQYGIADKIIITGYVPSERFPTYLACADVFLLPLPNTLYNAGRWPSKVCDYMASGRPIVSNPTGDIKDLFETHHVGCLADETVEDFAAKIKFLLGNPDTSYALGKNARRTAETTYAWSTVVKDLEKFYFKTIERTGKNGKSA